MSASTTNSKTRIGKGRDGWEARTEIGMGTSNRVLVITTHKTTGGVVTQATVNTLTDGMLAWEMFGDFSKRTVYKGVRCTEKTIRDLHQQALEVSDLTMSEAAAHYVKKDTKQSIASCLNQVPSMAEFANVAV